MESKSLKRRNFMRRIMTADMARVGCVITTAMAAYYAAICILVLMLLLVIGNADPIGALFDFALLGLAFQMPVWLFVGWIWTIFVLVESLRMGFVFGCLPESLALLATYFSKNILRLSENLVGLTSAKGIAPHILPVPAPSYCGSRACPPSPLPEDAWPSTNPRTIYH